MYWISNIPGEEDINFRVIPYCSIEGDYFLKPIHIGGSEFEHYRLPINYEKRDVKLIASDGNYGYFATGNVMRDVIICKLVGYDF